MVTHVAVWADESVTVERKPASKASSLKSQPLPSPLVWTGGSFAKTRATLSGHNYRFRDDSHEAHELHSDGLLTPRERDQVFGRLKLESKLKGWDDFRKDVLLADTQALSPRELSAAYPSLKAKDLTALSRAVAEFK